MTATSVSLVFLIIAAAVLATQIRRPARRAARFAATRARR